MDPKDELADLKQRLKVRQGKPGYSANVEAIKARIAELETQLG